MTRERHTTNELWPGQLRVFVDGALCLIIGAAGRTSTIHGVKWEILDLETNQVCTLFESTLSRHTELVSDD